MKKISNLKSQISNLKAEGFTLIEFLTVTIVVATIGLVIVGILTASIRGTNKTNIVNTVRVNGNQAIIQMTRMIEYAKNFEGVSLDGTSGSYTANCVPIVAPTPTPSPTPLQYKYLKIEAFDGKKIVFNCTSDNKLMFNNVSLIDSTKVNVASCWFSCSQDRITSNPIIGISFTLAQSGKDLVAENQASIPFETSVTFRNLAR